MWEIEWSLFYNLRTAKRMADSGSADRFFSICGDYTVDTDNYFELAWEGMFSVFPDGNCYFNEEIEAEAVVFFDPIIEEFCRLCREYEKKKRIPHEENKHWTSFVHSAWAAFQFDSYCYDYDLRCFDGHHGRPRIVLLMGQEFTALHEIPAALADVKDTLITGIESLETDLKPKKKRTHILKSAELEEAA